MNLRCLAVVGKSLKPDGFTALYASLVSDQMSDSFFSKINAEQVILNGVKKLLARFQ